MLAHIVDIHALARDGSQLLVGSEVLWPELIERSTLDQRRWLPCVNIMGEASAHRRNRHVQSIRYRIAKLVPSLNEQHSLDGVARLKGNAYAGAVELLLALELLVIHK
ncbi:hypothetical protein D3C72_1588500 [compost metagenome]